jgi:hypothetical protein
MICKRCKKEKLFTKRENGNFYAYCDDCQIKGLEYRRSHRQLYRDISKGQWKKHKEKYLPRMNQYKKDNKEHYDEYFKEYRMKNKDKIKKWHRDNYANNKAKWQTPKGRYSIYKHSAKSTHREFTLSMEEFMTFWQKSCFYCGNIPLTIGLDRIDNDKGYTIENIVSCCTTCNLMRKTLSQEIFINHCKLISKYHAY